MWSPQRHRDAQKHNTELETKYKLTPKSEKRFHQKQDGVENAIRIKENILPPIDEGRQCGVRYLLLCRPYRGRLG